MRSNASQRLEKDTEIDMSIIVLKGYVGQTVPHFNQTHRILHTSYYHQTIIVIRA